MNVNEIRNNKYGINLVYEVTPGKLVGDRISPFDGWYEQHETNDGIDFVKFSTKITDAWKQSGYYDKYMSISDYREWKKKNSKNPQKSLDDKEFRICLGSHFKGKYGDMKICLSCRVIKCMNCGEINSGSLQTVAAHYSIDFVILQYLIEMPMNEPSTLPKCKISTTSKKGVVS